MWLMGAILLATAACAQLSPPILRFEDFAVHEIFSGPVAALSLTTPEERRYRTVIERGVMRGWGVPDGITGKERGTPGPNFAVHYAIVTWGCGSPCLMMAVADLKTGHVFPPPFHHGPGHSYFQFPWLPTDVPMSFRLDSRLLIANICEAEGWRCGTHYFVMSDNGLQVVHAPKDAR
jgi:hypothetical protein